MSDPRLNPFSIAYDPEVERLTAENAELRRKLAKKEADNNPEPDDNDEDDTVVDGDVDSPHAPKKSKKGKKAGGEEDAEQPKDTSPDRDGPDAALRYQRAVAATAQAIILARQRARGIEPPRVVHPTDDLVLIAEVRAGYHPDTQRIEQQILACGRAARGEIDPPLPPEGFIRSHDS